MRDDCISRLYTNQRAAQHYLCILRIRDLLLSVVFDFAASAGQILPLSRIRIAVSDASCLCPKKILAYGIMKEKEAPVRGGVPLAKAGANMEGARMASKIAPSITDC